MHSDWGNVSLTLNSSHLGRPLKNTFYNHNFSLHPNLQPSIVSSYPTISPSRSSLNSHNCNVLVHYFHCVRLLSLSFLCSISLTQWLITRYLSKSFLSNVQVFLGDWGSSSFQLEWHSWNKRVTLVFSCFLTQLTRYSLGEGIFLVVPNKCLHHWRRCSLRAMYSYGW